MNMLLRARADVRANKWNDETVFDLSRSFNKGEMLEILNKHQQVSGIILILMRGNFSSLVSIV